MRQLRPARGTARLTLTINGQSYGLTPLAPHPSVARRAWRLRKPDGSAYDVALTEFGWTCECWPFLRGGDCKHLCGMKEAGLL